MKKPSQAIARALHKANRKRFEAFHGDVLPKRKMIISDDPYEALKQACDHHPILARFIVELGDKH
jgi:hypothetical protein